MARLFLRKKDLESEAGIELFALCQSLTGDGVIADEEVHALRDWLARNENTELPGAEQLRRLVAQVLEDGKITTEERGVIHKAVEAVLPPEYRQSAILKRREVQSAERERIRAERQAVKEESVRNRAVGVFDFMVAGVAFEGRAGVIQRWVRADDPIFLQRDPGNRHSRNAVKVLTRSGEHIGFVPEDDAKEMAPLLNSGHKHQAGVKKILTARRYPIPVVVALIYRPDATAEGLLSELEVPAALAASAPVPGVKSGVARALLVTIVVVLAALAMIVMSLKR